MEGKCMACAGLIALAVSERVARKAHGVSDQSVGLARRVTGRKPWMRSARASTVNEKCGEIS